MENKKCQQRHISECVPCNLQKQHVLLHMYISWRMGETWTRMRFHNTFGSWEEDQCGVMGISWPSFLRVSRISVFVFFVPAMLFCRSLRSLLKPHGISWQMSFFDPGNPFKKLKKIERYLSQVNPLTMEILYMYKMVKKKNW